MDRQLERNENDPRPFPGPSRGKSVSERSILIPF